MKCPVDNNILTRVAVKNDPYPAIHLDQCDSCHGIWVDAPELAPLLRTFTTDSNKTYESWLVANHTGVTEPKDFWQESARQCPHDGEILRRYYSPAAHKVGIEQCPDCHGFWFDGSELFAVAKANEPNCELDAAISAAAQGLQTEISDNYKDSTVEVWDITSDPRRLVPYIQDLLLNVMVGVVTKK